MPTVLRDLHGTDVHGIPRSTHILIIDDSKMYADLRQKMDSNLALVNGTSIDPFAEGWYSGADLDSMVVSDKVHPNWVGSAHIADRLIESFRAKGLMSVE
nr:hypothetical protein [Mycolicibacterium malmesburyense]CRL69093.1 lysophospholipase L1-like esterase [Mycolicibacterium malmesburyense]